MIGIGFDGEAYIEKQKNAIIERMEQFRDRLYVEVGGKFLYDGHASRVLPGFIPNTKERIFSSLFDTMDIIFCIHYDDIVDNRQLVKDDIDYTTYVMNMVKDIEKSVGKRPYIACNKCPRTGCAPVVESFFAEAKQAGYTIYKRYMIEGYPHNPAAILADTGYGRDEYIPVSSQLVLVTGAASNSGKMSTCLGQMYHEHTQGTHSGYAKYETFPIRNIPLKHPINLAYEAATADIGDYNMIDTHHQKAYGIDAVNYNRDVEAFGIVKRLADEFLPDDNYTRHYQSPTDMGINMAGFCIIDDALCQHASWKEIQRRKEEYTAMHARGEGYQSRIDRCESLEKECDEYIKNHIIT